MVNQTTLLSKMARSNGHGEESHYFDGWKAYESDPYHSVSNPNGVIQMGLAENQLCFDLIQEWIIKNPKASICSAEGLNDFKDIAIFQDYHGLPEFRNAVAKFMTRVRGKKVEFEPDRVVMSGGATGAQETLAFCLADSGDAFLVPTPYYPGFDRDLKWRTGIQLIPVTTKSSNGFKPDVETLQSAYDKATADKISVKGLLLTNPSNPLGTVLDKESLKSILHFAQSNNIHLICDEIYAGTVSGFPGFISISEIIEEEEQINRDLIHIIYSLSKDLGFPGFRVGIIYSYNDEVVNCARKMSSFGLVSTQTQRLVATMLNDDEFVNEFLERSANRLDNRRRVFAEELAKLGIGSLKGNAGLFLWMDLRGFLDEQNVEAEGKLWRVIINQVKLNVSPGSSFHCSEPGWFRVCIANMDDETVNASLMRIENFVAHSMAAMKRRKSIRMQKNLQVSLSFKRLQQQEALIMSPHSPISSPLVRART